MKLLISRSQYICPCWGPSTDSWPPPLWTVLATETTGNILDSREPTQALTSAVLDSWVSFRPRIWSQHRKYFPSRATCTIRRLFLSLVSKKGKWSGENLFYLFYTLLILETRDWINNDSEGHCNETWETVGMWRWRGNCQQWSSSNKVRHSPSFCPSACFSRSSNWKQHDKVTVNIIKL